MKKYLLILFTMFSQSLHAQRRIVDLTFIHTSDVHGAVFGYDYLKHQPTETGLPIVFAYTDSLRRQIGERLIMTDGGDCLQGQPTAYYSNYIDTTSVHLIAKVMNQMHYDCCTIGNHDIETGHAVYDRWVRQLNMPVLGANVIDKRTGKPYFTPYIILNRSGVKIAILGMVTAAIPYWLPENLWSNLDFKDITQSCDEWVKKIQEKEQPDLIVGLFHSGFNEGIEREGIRENSTEITAKQVPGFDFILYGHDHRAFIHEVKNVDGKIVKCMATNSSAARFVQADVRITLEDGKVVDKQIIGKPVSTAEVSNRIISASPNKENHIATLFEADFVDERLTLNNWVNRGIGTLTTDIDEADAYFGPSKFIDFIHKTQLELTGADISFAAPLSYNSHLSAGELTVNHMFNLYKFENLLYTMKLSGKEIKGVLEMSYGKWVNQMRTPEDHIMLIQTESESRRTSFQNMTFNFDSAAGIKYTVDVTKPVGQRINIESMADGTPFRLDKEYRVAVNSYRGNGGGELLTEGAGIPREELSKRILTTTEKDLRYHMMEYISNQQHITPECLDHWKFIPEELVKPAIERDRKLLFGE